MYLGKQGYFQAVGERALGEWLLLSRTTVSTHSVVTTHTRTLPHKHTHTQSEPMNASACLSQSVNRFLLQWTEPDSSAHPIEECLSWAPVLLRAIDSTREPQTGGAGKGRRDAG